MQVNWNCKEYDLVKEGEKILKNTNKGVSLRWKIT